jgi:hypothetical protein
MVSSYIYVSLCLALVINASDFTHHNFKWPPSSSSLWSLPHLSHDYCAQISLPTIIKLPTILELYENWYFCRSFIMHMSQKVCKTNPHFYFCLYFLSWSSLGKLSFASVLLNRSVAIEHVSISLCQKSISLAVEGFMSTDLTNHRASHSFSLETELWNTTFT